MDPENGKPMVPMGLGLEDDNEPVLTVAHGDDDTISRPDGSSAVYWIGTVEPLNAEDGDLWFGGDS